MKLTFRASRRILGGSALIVAAALLPGTALASTAAPAQANWFAPRCVITQTHVSLGRGSGAAGTIFYPLRFTNVSRRTCTMFGFPKTWAQFQDGRQIGNSSRRLGGIPQRVVTLVPGSTAHSTLGIIEASNICRKPVTAVTLRVRAPQQVLSRLIWFKFQACHGHVTVMVVGPVQPGGG